MSIEVFLADDHPLVRDGLEAIFRAQQEIVFIGSAADGRRAVQQILKLKPDVVLMDISMPNLNGIEATRQIIENQPAIGVIILSMFDNFEYINQAFQAGAKGYLLKLSATEEIFEAIRTVHTGHHYLSQRISEILVTEVLVKRDEHLKKSPLERLSSREREILQLVVEGYSSVKIGETLFISPKTVETYRGRLMEKLGICDLPTLVKFAIKHGLTPLE
ncbi:MAG: response regulator transcription factor [Deltaproteobacteria bacterium]|nr:response regulator transcription factor [Deltaproteobacteria bacterium]